MMARLSKSDGVLGTEPAVAPKFGQRPRRTRRDGAQLVELAMVLPVFFLLILGGIEFGRLLFLRHSAEQAAYEACRVAVVPGATLAMVRQRGLEILTATGLRFSQIDLVTDRGTSVIDEQTRSVTVRVTVPLNGNSLLTPFFFQQPSIQAQLTLDHENVAFGP